MKAKRKPTTKVTAKGKRPKSNADDAKFLRRLGQAYRDQESDICDLLTMAEITARASMGDEKGEAIFTAHHLRDMIDDFRQNWYEQHRASDEGAVS